MEDYHDRFEGFLSDFGKGRTMVLSTAENDVVSSRMMSVVRMNGAFYFQTDITFRKYRQLSANPNVALCIDNIQIEGTCEELGHPLKDEDFCDVFRECFRGSYDAYTSLENERLFVVRPAYIQRWMYKDGVPYIETFDVRNEEYSITQYVGV